MGPKKNIIIKEKHNIVKIFGDGNNVDNCENVEEKR